MSDRAADSARQRRWLAAHPEDRIAWHNLAAAEGDLGHAAEAEAAARRAIALGIGAPETRLVLARALQSQRRLDEAERAFEQAVALNPAYVEAHRDLAQLAWMRTGQASEALRRVDAAIQAAPHGAGLRWVRSLVLEVAGDSAAALAAAEDGLERAPDDVALLRQAAHLHAEHGERERALALALRAASAVPAGPGAEAGVCEALLALGRADEAQAPAAALRAARPRDQYAIALQATVWRLLGDTRYRQLCDYGTFVGTRKLEAPRGWPSLDEFLRALAADLEGLHSYRTHPLQNSVRGGSQLTLEAAELARPLVQALFASISVAVGEHLEKLGRGVDAMRSANTGRFAITGAWSVRLRSGGYHTDHVHPDGWLSSACYIALPDSVGSGAGSPPDRSGWLRLGKPNFRTEPTLEADHHVRPEPGLLALFPAYMWHGVEPFESARPRLSVAFDVVPA